MTKPTDAELKTAEAALAKKYRGIVRGSLTNVVSKGRFRAAHTDLKGTAEMEAEFHHTPKKQGSGFRSLRFHDVR